MEEQIEISLTKKQFNILIGCLDYARKGCSLGQLPELAYLFEDLMLQSKKEWIHEDKKTE